MAEDIRLAKALKNNIGSPVFCTVHPFTQPQIPVLYSAFQSGRHPKSAASHGGVYIPGSTWLNVSNCISISSPVFAQLTEEGPYTLLCALKHD